MHISWRLGRRMAAAVLMAGSLVTAAAANAQSGPPVAPVVGDPIQGLVGQTVRLCGPRMQTGIDVRVTSADNRYGFSVFEPGGQWVIVVAQILNSDQAFGPMVASAQLIDHLGQAWPMATYSGMDYDTLAAMYTAADPRMPIEDRAAPGVVLAFDTPRDVRGLLLQPLYGQCR